MLKTLSSWTRDHACGRLTSLVVLSVAFAALLGSMRLPAAVLLACMAAGVLLSVNERELRIPAGLFAAAQGVVGCLFARALQPSTMTEILRDWPIFVTISISVIAASGLLGWILMRAHVLPGTTAVWGLAPGAASAMVLMADSFGADMRLVAFMQYLRVVMVTIVASAVSRLWTASAAESAVVAPWFPAVAWESFGATLAVAVLGAALAYRLRIAAGALLLPLVIGVSLQSAGVLTIELPPAFLAAAYAVIGWAIGLRFSRPILVHAVRALPRILLSIFVLIAACVGLAALLTAVAGVDPLTAYLATSPGGADSVAIIAASSSVDVAFVMAMQLARFVMVLIIGPHVSRMIAEPIRSGRHTDE